MGSKEILKTFQIRPMSYGNYKEGLFYKYTEKKLNIIEKHEAPDPIIFHVFNKVNKESIQYHVHEKN